MRRVVRSAFRRRTVLGGGIGVILLAVAGCTVPFLGGSEAAQAPFEATPYEPGTSAARAEATATPTGERSTAASGSLSTPTPASTPEIADPDFAVARASASDGPLVYNGEVKAKSRVQVVAEVGGTLMEVYAEVGDTVRAGDVLARIDSVTLEAQRAQAAAALSAAQAQLNLLIEGAEETDIAAARAAVAAASAAYQRALDGPTEEDRRAAEAQVRQAQAAVTVAQAAYDRVKGDPQIGARPESQQLEQATLAVEAAQAQYDKLLKGSTDDVVAGAYAQLVQARAQLAALEEGAKPAQIEAAQAQVRQAEVGLYLSQLQLDKAVIRAPSDGIVTKDNAVAGAILAPGSPVAELMSLEKEVTIAVEEARLAQVVVGQPALIRVDAYPDRALAGEVIRVAPELDAGARTVEVTIRPTAGVDVLAPGMFATVTLLPQ